jgi:hypothetical protein
VERKDGNRSVLFLLRRIPINGSIVKLEDGLAGLLVFVILRLQLRCDSGIMTEDVKHKFDAGGVLLNIEGVDGAKKGYDQIYANIAKNVKGAKW